MRIPKIYAENAQGINKHENHPTLQCIACACRLEKAETIALSAEANIKLLAISSKWLTHPCTFAECGIRDEQLERGRATLQRSARG
jgi:hypothetical protein